MRFIMINLETKEVQEIVMYFTDKVNSLIFRPHEIAQEQKDSKEMKELDLYWIKILSAQEYQSDLRNQESADAGKRLAEIPFVKKLLEPVSNWKMKAVAEQLSREHRTLQQAFSELVFYHFIHTCSREETEELLEIMGDSFYILSRI